ncbi:Uncharacterised protein [Mycobacteroides abscessus subsp. abscessus]|nr:Uncharacterised protein [Mycobacteroides abscessus subsp. abscessus]
MQTCPLVGEVGVEVALLAVERHRRTREGDPLRVLRIGVAGHEDCVLGDAVGLHAALDQVDVQIDEAAHFDGPAEGDLAVALREVEIAERQVGARHEDGIEDATALGEILDVLIAAVLAGRCRPCSLCGDSIELRAAQ